MLTRTATIARRLQIIGVLSLAAAISACEPPPEPQTKTEDQQPEPAAPSSDVLAEVNGTPVTEEEVVFTIEHTFNAAEKMKLDAGLRKKVLESLIASKAMRQQAEKVLSDSDKKRITQKAKAYEEELFVKAYLRNQVTPQPVTGAQVEAYYRDNPARFGATPVREFELLSAPANLNEKDRNRLLGAIPQIRSASDWSGEASAWKQSFGLRYQSIEDSQAGLLDKPLESALNKLSQGETSDAIYLDGQLHLVRLTHVTQSSPKPLSEVSSDIRKMLAPIKLREAVKKASEKARSQADIRYTGQQ